MVPISVFGTDSFSWLCAFYLSSSSIFILKIVVSVKVTYLQKNECYIVKDLED